MTEKPRTLEELSHCPKCGNAGIPGAVMDLFDQNTGMRTGKKSHTFSCGNEICPWYDPGGSGWQIQVNPDGSIPPPLSLLDIGLLDHLAPPKMNAEARKIFEEIDPDGSLRRAAGIE